MKLIFHRFTYNAAHRYKYSICIPEFSQATLDLIISAKVVKVDNEKKYATHTELFLQQL